MAAARSRSVVAAASVAIAAFAAPAKSYFLFVLNCVRSPAQGNLAAFARVELLAHS